MKGRKDVMMDITIVGQLAVIKSLLPEEIKDIKHLGGNPTLSQLYLQNNVIHPKGPNPFFLKVYFLIFWKVT